MTLDDSVEVIKGIGPAAAAIFANAGIQTVGDLINYYPRRYEDYSQVSPISGLKPGKVTVRGSITKVSGRYVRRGMHVTEAVAEDATGSVRLVWFNQPYRATAIKHEASYCISGDFQLSHQKLAIMNPALELDKDFTHNTARIIPIYREARGLKSTQIRKAIAEIAPHIGKLTETLPTWIIDAEGLMDRSSAILALHFPDSPQLLEAARKRLGFEEVFELTLTALLIKHDALQETALQIPFNEALAKQFVGHLPFTLTDEQRKVIWHIYTDMQKTRPMNRLVEGDVGSGKTVVATMAALMAIEQGYQVAFMAPTELLARQHAETIYQLLQPLGLADHVSLLVGGMKTAQKKQAQEHIRAGKVRLIVGTHALIQEHVDMHKLGLVIIDEQHRFGVEQRKKLQVKAGHMPHVLSMTATPIPRSLALTLYGELDISVIAHKPKDRKPIITKLISPNSRKGLYESIDQQIAAGRQVFWVCPLITESSVSKDTQSVETVFKTLKQSSFKHRRVALLHGKLKADEKARIMQDFVNHHYDILVATTVIEVGVDVPNATVIVIESADRFGLAQLHQLRGRVGRSEHQGYCYPILSDSKPPTKRIKAFAQTSDGFRLSELDLELRGPGAIYGTLQHGALDLRIASLTDTQLISSARAQAQAFIDRGEKLVQYKHLAKRVQTLRAVTSLN